MAKTHVVGAEGNKELARRGLEFADKVLGSGADVVVGAGATRGSEATALVLRARIVASVGAMQGGQCS